MTSEARFNVAFWALLGMLVLVRVYFSVRVRQAGERLMPDRAAVEREGRGLFAARVAAFFLLIGLLGLYAVNPPWMQQLRFPLPDWLRWLGFVLGVVSQALLVWTQAELGKEWSAQLQVRESHRLVTTGPYARVRHPLYTAMFGLGASFALLSASWAFVALGLAMAAGLVARVPREEQMMIEEFGEAYREYMGRTGRFFPR